MNKKDAAIYLGITPRTLEWHVKQKNIGARKVRGKTGEIADFDEGELRKLKAQIDERRAPVHAVLRESHESHDTEPRNMTGLARLSDVSPEDFMQMLAQAYTAGVSEVMRQLPAMLPPAPNGEASTMPPAPSVWLTIEQASAWLGLPRKAIERALHDDREQEEKPRKGKRAKPGKLRTIKAIGDGRGFRLSAASIRAHFEGL